MKPVRHTRRLAAALLAAPLAAALAAPAPAVAADDGGHHGDHGAHAGHGPHVDRSRLPPRAAGHAGQRIKPAAEAPKPSTHGEFRTVCGFSHMAFDDPLVFPGQPGRSHLHVFFGNTRTDAFSTAASLAGSGNSTCRGGIANRSAYWVPATIDTRTGAPVRPALANIYYKNGYNGIRADQVQPFPKGLRMIAGDPSSTSPKGPWRFVCVGGGADGREHRQMPDCPVGSQLIQMVFFPQCWDGRNLDSPDHKRHMSYPVNRRCPASHPVPIPEITFNIFYDVREPGASRHWRLASDGDAGHVPPGRSMHGDWFDGWLPEVKEAWIDGCNRAARDCQSHLLGDGRQIY